MPRRKLLQLHEESLAAEAAAALEDMPALQPGTGNLYLWLMEEIAWDNMGWNRAQEAARAAVLDLLAAVRPFHTGWHRSYTGHQAKNAKRDAERRLLQELKMPEPYHFKVDFIDPRSNKEQLVQHETASILLQDYMSHFEEHWGDHFQTTFAAKNHEL